MEVIHALAPPILAIPVTIFAFAYEILIIGNARAFLARSGATDINSHIELLRSCLSFATFLVNSALFLVNCILAGVIYPIENIEVRIGLFLFEAAAVLGILFEIVYLLLNYELNDIAISNWPDFPRGWLPNMRIDKWLKYEQIGLNLLTIGLFLVGFGFSYAVPRGAAASHEKVETQITEISSAAKAQERFLTELKDIIAASREEQAQQQDAYFKRLDDINVKQDDVLKAVDKLRQTTSHKRKPIQTKSSRTGRGPNGRR